jgi:hypothetical protein
MLSADRAKLVADMLNSIQVGHDSLSLLFFISILQGITCCKAMCGQLGQPGHGDQ